MSVDILVLAAGASRRFNGIKQLAIIKDKTCIEICLDNLPKGEAINSFVALGANHQEILKQVPKGITPIFCPDWHLGMGHSLAFSVEQLVKNNRPILITLADQVLISTEHFKRLILASQKHPNKIIATSANQRFLPPVIFPARYAHQLTLLEGDIGAINLIKRNIENTISIECLAALDDIDTVDDLHRVAQIRNKQINNNHKEQTHIREQI